MRKGRVQVIMNGIIVKVKRARKTHDCLYGDSIVPGDTYTDVVLAPWLDFQDDPDAYPAKLGHWEHTRWHAGCRMNSNDAHIDPNFWGY